MQVRFNSHRLSGGAFVYPDAGPDARITFDTPEIGLGAAYHARERATAARSGWNKGEGPVCRPWNGRLLDRSAPLAYNVLIYPQYLATRQPWRTQAGG